jgi:hypothetical protein
MTYEAKVTLKYDSVWDHKGGIYDDEILPEEHFTFQVPAEDLNTIQLFQLFEKFCFAMGHNQAGIAKGAAYVAFNDMRTTEEMRKTAEEYDLVLAEDYHKKLVEYDKQQDDETAKLRAEICELKSKLADILPEQYDSGVTTSLGIGASRLRDYPRYDGSEWDTTPPYKNWKWLVPGSPEAVANSCSCPILDNEEMPDDKKWVNENCPLHGKVK